MASVVGPTFKAEHKKSVHLRAERNVSDILKLLAFGHFRPFSFIFVFSIQLADQI